ncbi:D-alanyl-D-alanine carboxypeptidase, partial [Mycolicibacterium austroafricanum]
MRPTRWRRSTYLVVGVSVLLLVVVVVAAAALVATRQPAEQPAVEAAPAPATAAPGV